MKTICMIVALVVAFGCSGRKSGKSGNEIRTASQTEAINVERKDQTETKALEGDRVEVIYFHGKQRCVTCRSIEQQTKEVLAESFGEAIKSGKVVFREVDISEKEGEKIADQYEVTWSSLFVNRWKDGQEQRNNMTEFAFAKAVNDAKGFKEGLKTKIGELMK